MHFAEILLKFVPKVRINSIPVLIRIMAWLRLSEPMMVSLLTLICVVRPQWVNYLRTKISKMLIKTKLFLVREMHLEMSSTKCQRFKPQHIYVLECFKCFDYILT